MDNITHTLMGVLLGETVSRLLPASASNLSPERRRRVLLGIGMVGSNLPDADFLASLVTQSKLDYLSQHRGYTHTLIGVVLGAAFLSILVELWCRWRETRPSASDRKVFAGLALCALFVHLAMDYTNSYGVHPLWPFYNGWVYGDAVFIVEPALWVAAAPLYFLMRSMAARSLIALVLVASMALSFGSGWIPFPNAIVLALLLVALLMIGHRARAASALATACGAWLSITGIFVMSGYVAGKEVERSNAALFPEERLLDHVLTPLPANPLCWDVIAVITHGNEYGLRRGVLSLAPGLQSPAACHDKTLAGATTALLQPITQRDRDAGSIHWQDEWHMPQQQFAALVSSHCEAQILMRFARAPFVRERPPLILGDLRFDREAGRGFAEIEIKGGPSACIAGLPPWTPPRQELLMR